VSQATRPVEWLIAIAGGLALTALLVWLLRGDELAGDAATPPPAETVAAPALPAPAVAVPPAALTPPALPAAVMPELPPLKLRGIVTRSSGASAMVEFAGGAQRLVRVGGTLMPGVTVTAIAADRVTLLAGGGERVLRFDDAAAGTGVAAAPEAAAPSRDPRIAMLAATSADWRLGLTAEKRDGRTIGYRVVDSARLPLLRRAGVQPGDILTAINGSGLTSEEKIIDLPAEIAGAYAVELAYLRGGSARTATVPVNR
jgi:type II secretory pathway component PulC